MEVKTNMKVKVNKDLCIECGLCVSTAPEVFKFDTDGKAEEIVDTVPNEMESAAQDSVDGCPTSAIEIG